MPLRALILHNFWLKFFSVALATVIWMAIHYSISHDFAFRESDVKHLTAHEYLRIPILAVASPGDPRTFRIMPPQVNVVALGDDSLLHNISQKNIRVHVDLTEFQGRRATDVEVHADVPQDVTLISIIPPSVTVEQTSK